MPIKKIPVLNDFVNSNPTEALDIYIRGDSFRGSIEQQILCLRSILEFIIYPVLVSGKKVKVIQCTYEHDLDYIFEHELNKNKIDIDFQYLPFSKKDITSQAQCFIKILELIHDSKKSALVIRPDLVFEKALPVDRLSDDMLLFQWNTFHNFRIKEVPDQMHYVGKNIIRELMPKIKENPEKISVLPNNLGKKSLHNFYNRASDILGSDKKISYLYYFELLNNDYAGARCTLRGNSDVSTFPEHIYSYNRNK